MANIYSNFKFPILILGIVFLLFSCKKDSNSGTEIIRINFFKEADFNGMVLSMQSDKLMGTDKWYGISEGIDGFNYEQGYIYDLLVSRVPVKPFMADGPSFTYKLKRVITKKKVNADATFKSYLKANTLFSQNYINLFNGNLADGFILANKVKIDCGGLCNELDQVAKTNALKSGTFTVNTDGSIKLLALN